MKCIYSPFDRVKAIYGAMCVMLAKSYSSGDSSIDSSSKACYGIGVARSPVSNVFLFETEGDTFTFDAKGNGTSSNSADKVLRMVSRLEEDSSESVLLSKIDNIDHSAEDIYDMLKEVRELVKKPTVSITYVDNK